MSGLRGRCKHCDGYYCDNLGGCPVGEVVARSESPPEYVLTMGTWKIDRLAEEMQKQQGGIIPTLKFDAAYQARAQNLSQQWACVDGTWKRVG